MKESGERQKNGGDRRAKSTAPNLKDLKISGDDSANWQQLARNKDHVEAQLADKSSRLSTRALLAPSRGEADDVLFAALLILSTVLDFLREKKNSGPRSGKIKWPGQAACLTRPRIRDGRESPKSQTTIQDAYQAMFHPGWTLNVANPQGTTAGPGLAPTLLRQAGVHERQMSWTRNRREVEL
jgi:hypothetical protein